MHYSIATLDLAHSPLSLEIYQTGNKTGICLYNSDTKESTRHEYCTRDDAWSNFQTIGKWMTLGLYTEQQKRDYLAKGEMP